MVFREHLFLVKKVSFVFEKELHSPSCNMQDVSSVFIDVSLKIHDLFRPGNESCLGGLGLCVLLKGFAIGIGVHLLGLKEQEFDLSEILLFKSLAEIREFLVGSPWVPGIPNGLIEDRNMDLISGMQRHVLQAIEESPEAGGLSGADAGQGANSLFGLDVVDANGEGESFASGISAGGRNGQGDCMSSRKGARFQGFP